MTNVLQQCSMSKLKWLCVAMLLVVGTSVVLYNGQVTSWIQTKGTVKKQPQFFHLKSTRLSQPTKPPSLKKIAELTVSHWKTDSCPQTTTIQKEKKCGFFSVLPYVKQLRFFVESGGKFEVGDTLRVVFLAKDKQGNIATNIGDFFQASIINMKTKSGAVGIIKDHQNGTYTATFQLLWSGEVNIIVKLIHPRQAIDVIERTACEHPFDKLMFLKRYIIGAAKIDTKCNVDPAVLNSHTPVCNYSDPHAGGWWYCEKAANISCDTPGYHRRLSTHRIKLLRKGEEKLFGRGMNGVKRAIAGSPSKVNVMKGLDPLINRPRCTPGLPTPPISGFYAGGIWNSLICHNRHFSNQSEWRTCLRGKTLHFMGDSTIRQWYEQLVELLNLSESSLPDATHQTGPLLARDTTNNITVKYRAHGTPRRCNWAPVSNLQYVSNLIDRIKWGPNDVVGISVWAHFTSYPVDMYRERMEAIRAAIQRLHQRSPQTLVVIKSANTRMGDELIAGDWLAYQLDLVMREMFQGMNVVLVDAWEMTTAQQWHRDAVHPAGDIVIQELEFLCSFL